MESRSSYLYRIEIALSARGLRHRINSVPELRSLFPGLPDRLDLKALEQVALQAETIDIALWQNPPPKQTERPDTRVGALSYEEIRRRRAKKETLKAIALDAGISSERVRQICKLPEGT